MLPRRGLGSGRRVEGGGASQCVLAVPPSSAKVIGVGSAKLIRTRPAKVIHRGAAKVIASRRCEGGAVRSTHAP